MLKKVKCTKLSGHEQILKDNQLKWVLTNWSISVSNYIHKRSQPASNQHITNLTLKCAA